MSGPLAAHAVSRRGGVAPFHVMRVIDAVAARRAQGLPVIDLSAGQPSTPAPATVRAAAAAALDGQVLGYTNALGIASLRSAVAGHYARIHGLDVDPASVAVTTGSSGGFLYAFLAAFDAGDTVAMARPGYPAYRNMLAALGCRVLELPCGPDTRFQPTVAHLDALETPPAGLVIASPANPTGSM
jgi:aspartate/methionine/tyrosine aminotransferase